MSAARRLMSVVASVLVGSTVPAGAAPFVYVANYGDAIGTVSVIDAANQTVVDTVEVGTNPLGVAVSPDGSRVYVTNQKTLGTLTIIDAGTNAVATPVPVGAGPSGVAVKLPGTKVYVANRDDKTVSVFDVGSGVVTGSPIAVGNNPLGVAVNPAGTPAYVVNKGSDSVTVIDTNLDTVITTVDVGNDPTHVAVSPNGSRVLVTNGSNSSVSVIDAGTNTVIDTIAVGNTPEGIAFDPDGTHAYVANNGPNTVSVIDTLTGTVSGPIVVGVNPFDLTVDPTGSRLYVTNRGGASVSVIDLVSGAVATTVDVGLGPTGFGSLMMPGLRPPVLPRRALACQKALATRSARIAKADYTQETACERRRVEAASGVSDVQEAEGACTQGEARIAAARRATIASLAGSCRSLAPVDLNGPCRRSAATMAETATCVLAQHETRVDEMVDAVFTSGAPLALSKTARACQARLSAQALRFAATAHAKQVDCLGRLLREAARGRGTSAARVRCMATLDVSNGASALSQVRAAAIARTAKRCKGLGPTDIGNPCDPSATTIEETAACVLDEHLRNVSRMVAAEFNDACTMLTGIGLGSVFPEACKGP